MRRALVAAAVTVLALAGCASNEEQSAPEETRSASASEQAGEETPTAKASENSGEDSGGDSGDDSGDDSEDAIEVEIEGNRIEPNGKRVQIPVGDPVVLRVKSDRAAELHVHASPEQVVEVKKGESTVRFTVKTPGVVDVEEHETGTVILQLQVS